jgi:hypothetical protein
VLVFATVREHCSIAKDKGKKHETAEEKAASDKMKRKEFEKELAKLQVELVRLEPRCDVRSVPNDAALLRLTRPYKIADHDQPSGNANAGL